MWHLSDCIDNPIRVVRETGHIWILSGVFNDSDKNYLFYEDQDRISNKPHSSENRQESRERFGENRDAIDYEGFQEGIQEFGINPKCFSNLLKPPVSHYALASEYFFRIKYRLDGWAGSGESTGVTRIATE